MENDDDFEFKRQKLIEAHLSLIKSIESTFTDGIIQLFDRKIISTQNILYKDLYQISNDHELSNNIIKTENINEAIDIEHVADRLDHNRSVDNLIENMDKKHANDLMVIKQEEQDDQPDIILDEDGYEIRRNGISDYKCHHCKKAFVVLSQFRDHNSIKHNDERPFHCKYNGCNYSVDDGHSLKIHKEGVHQKKIKYTCNYCAKGFYAKSHYDNHIRIHTGEKPFKCNQCPKSFKRSDHLKGHIDGVHKNIRKNRCTQCNHTFYLKRDLKRHIDEIHKRIKHKCDVCGKSYHRKTYLKDHMRSHTGSKPYQCSKCKKRFATSRERRQHKCKA